MVRVLLRRAKHTQRDKMQLLLYKHLISQSTQPCSCEQAWKQVTLIEDQTWDIPPINDTPQELHTPLSVSAGAAKQTLT